MAHPHFRFAGPLVSLLGVFACGGDDAASSSGPDKTVDGLCQQIAAYAEECGASTGACDQALVADCSNVTGLLGDSFVDAVSACLTADPASSPMGCFTKAMSGLQPGASQTELVKSVCQTCTDIPLAPSSLEATCESAFIEGFDVE